MRKLLIFFLTITICISIACETDTQKTDEKKTETEPDFDTSVYTISSTFGHILQIIKQKHYRIKDFENSAYEALDTLLNKLDPHSNFLSPKSYKNILSAMNGEFCGIGVVIDVTRQTKDRFLTVVDTIPDGPSEKIGVKALDKIVEIDGQVLEGMSTEEATARLKGKKDTKVMVKILREGKGGAEKAELLTFNIIRDIIKEQNSRSFLLSDQNICYVAFNMFTENSVTQLEKLFEQAHKNKYKGIILDLRNNSGGLLQSAVDIAGLFLDKGSLVVVTKDKNNKEIERYVTRRNPITYTTPFIIVLINNYTASAAEILAGCLKNHSETHTNVNKPIVILLGTKTFGKGSVQEIIPIGGDCAVKITTSLYYLPDGNSIQGKGIKPDIEVEKTMPLPEQIAWFNENYGREQSLANYIKQNNSKENNQDKKAKKKTDVKEHKNFLERSKELLEGDNQFHEAIRLISLLNSVKTISNRIMNTRPQVVNFLKNNYNKVKDIKLIEIKI